MIPKFCAFVILTLCTLASRSSAQDCVPKRVVNMTLDFNQHLSWEISADEQCEITQFLVYMFQAESPDEYAFSVNDRYADVSFLPTCVEWTFVVIPVSGYVVGPEFRLVDSLPLPANANLSIAYINVTANDATGDTHLHWDFADSRIGNCSLRYRVSIEHDDSSFIDDLYVDHNHIDLHFLAPCTSYQFRVRAINLGHPIIEGPLRTAYHDFPALRQGPPTLVAVDASATVLNLAFRLESFIRNPCPIRELTIEGGAFFNQSVVLHDSGVTRPLVNVTIDSLSPNRMYFLRASVQNSGGWSQASLAAIQTADLIPDKA